MKQKLLCPVLIVLLILFFSSGVILYGRGYRIDLKKKSLKTTGLLAATSTPTGASVFISRQRNDEQSESISRQRNDEQSESINERLVSATNDTLNLEPGWYNIRLIKEGYIPWEKKIEIKKEVVAETNATLFPSNPSLSPLTSTGAKSPTLSPDGTKIAYIIPYSPQTRDYEPQASFGVFILDLNSYPLPFSRKPSQIFVRKILTQEEVSLLWSPDSTQVLLHGENFAFLLDLNKKNESPQNLIGTLPALFLTWERGKEELEKRRLLSLPEPLIEVFRDSVKILSFSPDESKVLYQATASATISNVIKPPLLATNPTKENREIEPSKVYVYDRKEDRNYLITEQLNNQITEQPDESLVVKLLSVAAKRLQWLPTSRHLILTEEGKISILEYDGTNKATVYASPFEENFVAPWPSGEKLVILTTLNPASSTLPNLYALSLR